MNPTQNKSNISDLNKSVKLLGKEIFKRIIISENELQFDSPIEYGVYSGLTAIAHLNNVLLEYDSANWFDISIECIVFTIHNMIRKNEIQLSKVFYKEQYLGFINSSEYYYFKLTTNISDSEDILSNVLIQSVNAKNDRKNNFKQLQKVIERCIEGFIGNDLNAQPEKEFLFKIMRYYSRLYNEVNLTFEKKNIFASGLKLQIKDELVAKFAITKKKFLQDFRNSCSQSKDYNLFFGKLRKIIYKDFESRYPNDEYD